MNMFCVQISHILRQYVLVIVANLAMVIAGIGQGWISPVLVKLRSESDPVLSRPVTEEEGSWIVSSMLLSMLFCNGIAAYLADHVGRKYAILIGILPWVGTCVFYILASELWMVIVGRVLSGISLGFCFTLVPTYAAEIASKEVRGSLGSIMQITCTIGVVTMLCIGPYLTYLTLNIVLIITTILVMIPFLYLPDTPYFLYSKGRIEESKHLLVRLRGSEFLAEEELKEYALAEIDSKVYKIQLFKDKIFLKVLAMVIIVGIGGQMSGFNIISMYLQTILEETNTSIKSQLASVVIGIIQFAGSCCTSFITDKFGRKPILITTYFGMASGMLGLGVFFKLKASSVNIDGALNYLPIVCLILFVFCYTAGHGTIYFILVSELVEGPARATLSSLGIQTTALCLFVTIKFFSQLTTVLSPAVVYWIFSTVGFLTGVFVAIFIPETKGKSFSEIQEKLGANRNGVVCEKL